MDILGYGTHTTSEEPTNDVSATLFRVSSFFSELEKQRETKHNVDNTIGNKATHWDSFANRFEI